MDIKANKFNDFTVYSCDECTSFYHIDIDDKTFYVKLFDYFFSEDRILSYIENKSSISFTPTIANYVALYRKLSIFIDQENDVPISDDIEKEILDILNSEYQVVMNNGKPHIRLDKIGKIGEYIFSNLLSEFFNFQCIIPKLNMITDNNMSIFGIDTLFYSSENRLILLGESKVSKSLENGVNLVNKSLLSYQDQVDEEYTLILSQRWLKDKMGDFAIDFSETCEISLTMQDFILNADIKCLGIPIFIAFGEKISIQDHFEKLKKIKKISLYGLDTKYYSISLPVLNKDEFVEIFTAEISKKKRYYESQVK